MGEMDAATLAGISAATRAQIASAIAANGQRERVPEGDIVQLT